MKLWAVEHFFITFGWVQQQTHPKVCSTAQSFIRKEVTSYKICILTGDNQKV